MSVRESVLEALENNRGTYLSGEKLSEQLDVSRAAVWKAIRRLREEGYPIDAVTGSGYALPKVSRQVTEEEVRRYLPAKYRNNSLYIYDILDSTNLRARQIALEGDSPSKGRPAFGNDPGRIHGTAVIAAQQTAGRGRLGRSFFSPKEGLYLSVIIKPDFDLSASVLVTVAAAAAVAEAIDDVCGAETEIKWVNDVYLDGKKVCGILTEGITDFETGGIDHLVIGIGVNTSLRGFPEELLSVAGAVEGDYSRSALAAGIISRLLAYTEALEERAYIDTYRNKSLLTGRDIKVFKGVYRKDPAEEIDGRPARVLGIDADGGLQVIYTDGSRETLTTGEVTVRL